MAQAITLAVHRFSGVALKNLTERLLRLALEPSASAGDPGGQATLERELGESRRNPYRQDIR
jgi:hypothetical protein